MYNVITLCKCCTINKFQGFALLDRKIAIILTTKLIIVRKVGTDLEILDSVRLESIMKILV